jgi:hypothetical protein
LIRESKEALVTLSDLIRQRQVIPLVGSGLSVAAGYPTWTGLLDTFQHRIAAGADARLRSANVGGKYIGRLPKIPDVLWRAQEYRRLLGDADFFGVFSDVFKPRRLPPRSPLHALTRLGFPHYLTTNYDDLIERALRSRRVRFERLVWGSDRYSAAAAQFVRELSSRTATTRVVYLHGRYDIPQECVLADGDYFRRYVATDETQKRLFAVFLTQSVLFVGFSMTDPELTALFRAVRGLFQQVTPWHYAVMPVPADQPVEVATSYYQYRYGVTPIFYEPSPNHEGLTEVLTLLARASGATKPVEPRRSTRWVPKATESAALANLPTEDPDDPNKGRFGGRSSAHGWSLAANVSESDEEDWFTIVLTVTAPRGKRLRDRKVKFHLHPTFNRSTQTLTLTGRRATLERHAYGAFTVGVEADGGDVKLELDLAEVDSAPALFKQR